MTARSRAYPIEDLHAAVSDVDAILEAVGRGNHSRATLADALGYQSAAGGVAGRKVAALTQYGFLRRREGRYAPTDLAERVCHPRNDQERTDTLRKALYNPPLFREVLGRYEPEGRLPQRLSSVLFRDFGITSAASETAADVLRNAARQAGVLDDNDRFESRKTERDLRSLPYAEPKSQTTSSDVQRLELALTEGKMARLVLPRRLSSRDLEILERQLEILRLAADA